MLVKAELADLASRGEATMFFHKVGQLVLANADAASELPYNTALTSAAAQGVICIADGAGVHICATGDVAYELTRQHGKDEPSLAFNCNSSVLAVILGPEVHLYSVQAVLYDNATKPLTSWYTRNNAAVIQAIWSPSNPRTCAVITQDKCLLTGRLGTQRLQAVAGVKHAACVAWSPDGRFLTYGWADNVHVYNTATSRVCWSTQIAYQGLKGEGFDDPSVDSLMWVSPNCILVCSGFGPEADQAQIAMLRWESWDAANTKRQPKGLVWEEPWPAFWSVTNTTPHDQGPHLIGVGLPGWELALTAHRNATDDHVRIFSEASQAALQQNVVVVVFCRLYSPVDFWQQLKLS